MQYINIDMGKPSPLPVLKFVIFVKLAKKISSIQRAKLISATNGVNGTGKTYVIC